MVMFIFWRVGVGHVSSFVEDEAQCVHCLFLLQFKLWWYMAACNYTMWWNKKSRSRFCDPFVYRCLGKSYYTTRSIVPTSFSHLIPLHGPALSLLYTQSILIPFALLTEQTVNEIKGTNVIKVAPCLFIMRGFTVIKLTVGTSFYQQAHTQITLSPGSFNSGDWWVSSLNHPFNKGQCHGGYSAWTKGQPGLFWSRAITTADPTSFWHRK